MGRSIGSRPIPSGEDMMAGSFVQWNIRGLNANFEELCLLTNKYKPAVISLQETLLNRLSDKTRSLTGFNIVTTVRLTAQPPVQCGSHHKQGSNIFSPMQLDTPLQAVAARIT